MEVGSQLIWPSENRAFSIYPTVRGLVSESRVEHRKETLMSVGDILTQIGPGTPMGALMREYWMPALLSNELKSDGAPVRLRLLGENLIAFRDTEGRVGILDHVCPHR